MCPAFMTAIVSAIDIASSWSCVTCTNVMPTSCWMRLSSICSCLRRRRSSAPSGSSRSSARGRFTSARASATRCCWPPDSWAGLRLPRWPSCTSSSASLRARADIVLGDLAPLEPERDVLLDAQVREERVGLEDGVDVALVRRVLRDVLAAEEDACRRSGPRSRRSCAASWSCRSRTGPAARRTRRAASPGPERPRRSSRRSASSPARAGCPVRRSPGRHPTERTLA